MTHLLFDNLTVFSSRLSQTYRINFTLWRFLVLKVTIWTKGIRKILSPVYGFFSVAHPDPNLYPHVFGPPGSGSISQRYGSGSGSGSFYHHAKIVRKTLIPIILWLFLTFFFLKDVNVTSMSNKQKKLNKKLVFCWYLEGLWRK